MNAATLTSATCVIAWGLSKSPAVTGFCAVAEVTHRCACRQWRCRNAVAHEGAVEHFSVLRRNPLPWHGPPTRDIRRLLWLSFRAIYKTQPSLRDEESSGERGNP